MFLCQERCSHLLLQQFISALKRLCWGSGHKAQNLSKQKSFTGLIDKSPVTSSEREGIIIYRRHVKPKEKKTSNSCFHSSLFSIDAAWFARRITVNEVCLSNTKPCRESLAGCWCEALTKWRSRFVVELSAGNVLHRFISTSKLRIGWECEMGLISIWMISAPGKLKKEEACRTLLNLQFNGRDFCFLLPNASGLLAHHIMQ